MGEKIKNKQTILVASGLETRRCVASLTLQSELSERSVTSGLQQLPDYPVGLLQLSLHHRHPPPVPRQHGRHGRAQDSGPDYHHIRLRGRRGATVCRNLRGRGLHKLPFPCPVTLRKESRARIPLQLTGIPNRSGPWGKYLKHVPANNLV